MRKSLLGLLAIAAIGEAQMYNTGDSDRTKDKEMPTTDERTRQDEKNLEKYYLSKGLKKFQIGQEVVWARNLKNAQRKAKKQ